MRIEGLEKYQRRNRKGYFDGLSPVAQHRAREWLSRFVQRRQASGQKLPQWKYAILVGQAKRLALNPPTSEWGRSMHAKKGGYAVQREYRMEGRNPLVGVTAPRAQPASPVLPRARLAPRDGPRLLVPGFVATICRGVPVPGKR